MKPAPSRPVLRRHGSKWKLAPWTKRHSPPHRVYIDRFDGTLACELRDVLKLTPFALTDFKAAYEQSDNLIERCRGRVIHLFMGFCLNAHAGQAREHRSIGFRASSNPGGTTTATDWGNYPAALGALVDRLQSVVRLNPAAIEKSAITLRASAYQQTSLFALEVAA